MRRRAMPRYRVTDLRRLLVVTKQVVDVRIVKEEKWLVLHGLVRRMRRTADVPARGRRRRHGRRRNPSRSNRHGVRPLPLHDGKINALLHDGLDIRMAPPVVHNAINVIWRGMARRAQACDGYGAARQWDILRPARGRAGMLGTPRAGLA